MAAGTMRNIGIGTCKPFEVSFSSFPRAMGKLLSDLSSTLFVLISQYNWLSSLGLLSQSRLTGGYNRASVLGPLLVHGPSPDLVGQLELADSSTWNMNP